MADNKYVINPPAAEDATSHAEASVLQGVVVDRARASGPVEHPERRTPPLAPRTRAPQGVNVGRMKWAVTYNGERYLFIRINLEKTTPWLLFWLIGDDTLVIVRDDRDVTGAVYELPKGEEYPVLNLGPDQRTAWQIMVDAFKAGIEGRFQARWHRDVDEWLNATAQPEEQVAAPQAELEAPAVTPAPEATPELTATVEEIEKLLEPIGDSVPEQVAEPPVEPEAPATEEVVEKVPPAPETVPDAPTEPSEPADLGEVTEPVEAKVEEPAPAPKPAPRPRRPRTPRATKK